MPMMRRSMVTKGRTAPAYSGADAEFQCRIFTRGLRKNCWNDGCRAGRSPVLERCRSALRAGKTNGKLGECGCVLDQHCTLRKFPDDCSGDRARCKTSVSSGALCTSGATILQDGKRTFQTGNPIVTHQRISSAIGLMKSRAARAALRLQRARQHQMRFAWARNREAIVGEPGKFVRTANRTLSMRPRGRSSTIPGASFARRRGENRRYFRRTGISASHPPLKCRAWSDFGTLVAKRWLISLTLWIR